ncbi:MAG: dipeptidase [Lachnospirales bacterium]
MFFVDLHCDTITKAEDKKETLKENNLAVDINRLLSYECPIQCFAIWHNFSKISNPFERAKKSINFYKREISKNSMYIGHINNYEDFLLNYNSFKISSMLSLEGGEALENSIENLHFFYNEGVRSLNLTWNNNNSLASSCYSDKYGVTDFGLEVLNEMEKLKMFVDFSHLSKKGIKDVVEKTNVLVMASHSNSKEILNHKRNLSNYELKLIKEKDGLVGLNLYLPFLINNETSSVTKEDFETAFSKHIEQMIKILSEDNIAIGSDFDGADDFYDLAKDVTSMPYLFSIVESKFGNLVAKKIFGDNFLRQLKKL